MGAGEGQPTRPAWPFLLPARIGRRALSIGAIAGAGASCIVRLGAWLPSRMQCTATLPGCLPSPESRGRLAHGSCMPDEALSGTTGSTGRQTQTDGSYEDIYEESPMGITLSHVLADSCHCVGRLTLQGSKAGRGISSATVQPTCRPADDHLARGGR